jgi:hypothetical protein
MPTVRTVCCVSGRCDVCVTAASARAREAASALHERDELVRVRAIAVFCSHSCQVASLERELERRANTLDAMAAAADEATAAAQVRGVSILVSV